MSTRYEWAELRDYVRQKVEADRRALYPDLRLTEIDFATGDAARAWRGPNRIADWDWVSVMKRPSDNRFEVAIWHQNRLCGLAFGPGSDEAVGMEYLEGDPDPFHPLKKQVFKIALAVLETQVFLSGARFARLLGPKEALIPFYKLAGYDLPSQPIGCIALEKAILAEP